MIRIYGYYSVGGYKDMYIGSSQDKDELRYFLPLLPVMRRRKTNADIKALAWQEKLPQIELLKNENMLGFPEVCKKLFSHGGYIALYETLPDGKTCLAVRDIPNSQKDDEGRETPFNLLFLADDEEGIRTLDAVALAMKADIRGWLNAFTPLFFYEPKSNGIAFRLAALLKLMDECPKDKQFKHIPGMVDYIMVARAQDTSLTCKELKLEPDKVTAFIDIFGKPLKRQIKVEDVKFQEKKPTEKEDETIQEILFNDKPALEDIPKEEKLNQKASMKSEKKEHEISFIAVPLAELKGKMDKLEKELQNIAKQQGDILDAIHDVQYVISNEIECRRLKKDRSYVNYILMAMSIAIILLLILK